MSTIPAAAVRPSGRLDRWWRVVGTGLSFALFGVVGLLGSVTLFPLVGLTTRDPDTVRRRSQWIVHRWFGLFAGFMKLVGVISVEVRDAERLRRPGALVIANHPSLIDVVLLIAHIPEVDCIVKRAVFANPFMRWPAKWAGYICHDTPEQLIADCTAALRHGHSLMIFPESTRSVPGQPIRMMHGAARIALEAGATVLPVTIDCQPSHLPKGRPWYRVPPRRAHYLLTVGEPLPLPADGTPLPVAARRLTHHWEQYFAARTGGAAAHPAAGAPLAEDAAPAHYSLPRSAGT